MEISCEMKGGYWIYLIPLSHDGVHGHYEIHCVKNTWSYCSVISPAMRNSVTAQVLPSPSEIFVNL